MNIRIFLLAVVSLVTINIAYAADIETLFMPGELIQGHADIESECSNCHVRFKKSTQSQLCRDCHEDVDADVSAGTGYHGRIADISTTSCTSCHTDHIGRNADIVLLNRSSFNHAQTDFRLEHRHTTVSCAACHEPEKKFSEAAPACHDCHGKQDPHAGNLGEQCGDCHTAQGWKDTEFDHKKTDFPLLGKHLEASCSACHLETRYENTPQDCNSCHYLNDSHNGRNGDQCQDCHNPKRWDQTDFDHQKQTEFALRGKHRDISCESCHSEALGNKKPPSDCYGCHRNDDQHKGRYGEKCQSCHTEKSWKKADFDHTTNTDFPLKGAHSELVCSACHRGDVHQEELSTQCFACHRGDDVHRGQEGEQCERCHRETSWSERVLFDHDLSRFPLLGLHATTPCEECHRSAAFQDTEIECYACHKSNDEHKGTLGTDCHLCHNPNGWAIWMFDHNEQTDFKLDGAHEELHCESCHHTPIEDGPSLQRGCNGCHEGDDTHDGRFGRNCERCHNTQNFSDVTIQ